MKKIGGVTLLGLIGLCACSEKYPAETAKIEQTVTETAQREAAVSIDTAASFRIGTNWVTPDSLFEFNTLVKAREDTLHLVACQRYIIEPFGPVENKAQLQSGLLQDFTAITMSSSKTEHSHL